MTNVYPRFKAAACHAASVFLDAAKSAEKACDLIAEAARGGANWSSFPNRSFRVFRSGQRCKRRSPRTRFSPARVASGSSRRARVGTIRRRRTKHGVVVSSRNNRRNGCQCGLYVEFQRSDRDGRHNHQSSSQAGSDILRKTDLGQWRWSRLARRRDRVGRLGMLICGENTNPLARFALMAQGEQCICRPIHRYGQRGPRRHGGYDLRRAIEIRAGNHAFEAKVFNVVASGCVDQSLRRKLSSLDKAALDTLENTPRGVSMIIDPTGEMISDVLSEHEGIVYADIDLARCVEPKQFHDVVGYYNRFDIFRLEVDRTPREPATFLETESERLASGDRLAPSTSSNDHLEGAKTSADLAAE